MSKKRPEERLPAENKWDLDWTRFKWADDGNIGLFL